MGKRAIKIGITIGDPAGIGPEVALKALQNLKNKNIIPVLICRKELIYNFFPKETGDFHFLEKGTTELSLHSGKKYIYDVPINLPIPVPGKGNINTGLESRKYIDTSISLWKRSVIDAIVTGPVNKGLIEKSGTAFCGHTEYIAKQINEDNPLMLMYSELYRVLLITTHIPVNEIYKNISIERIVHVILEGAESIKAIDNSHVKIAITGMDPHCGDDGAIGNFDNNVTIPAVKIARSKGINIDGPFSADTIFIPEKWEKYNLVIAHYHDQGLIPFKMLAFEKGVNVTLGLSITRTSVDHGTGYDIAGKGKAGFNSMLEAIKLAYRIEQRRRFS